MRSKNSRAHDADESAHLAAVKSVACVCCDAPPPVEAHHVVQGDHFTACALCKECHTGKRGIHGDQSAMRLRFRIGGTAGELRAINETLRRVAELNARAA